jgi:hypothetical protein
MGEGAGKTCEQDGGEKRIRFEFHGVFDLRALVFYPSKFEQS